MKLSLNAFLGEGEHTFALPRRQLAELEASVGPIMTLYGRLVARAFGFADLAETIRCALIGGGASPQEAARLIETYVDPRPIVETLPLALAILEARLSGIPDEAPTTEGAA